MERYKVMLEGKHSVENFRIFLSFKFYVKSIFWESRSSKTAVIALIGAVNFVNLVKYSFKKVQKLPFLSF